MVTGRFAMYSANPNMAASRQTVFNNTLFKKFYSAAYCAVFLEIQNNFLTN